MISVFFSPSFLKKVKKLNPSIQQDVYEAVEKVKDTENHKTLKLYKLQGKLKDYYSFSVSYSIRIICVYKRDLCQILCVDIENHGIYD